MTKPHAFTLELTRPRAAAIETLRAALTAEQMGTVSGRGVREATPGRTHTALQARPVIADASDNPDVRAACELASAA